MTKMDHSIAETEFRIWRKAMGWTQKTAGQRLGRSPVQINRYDTGKQDLDTALLLAMSALCRNMGADWRKYLRPSKVTAVSILGVDPGYQELDNLTILDRNDVINQGIGCDSGQ